jgi:membrane-associated phospholipid phosphatase
VLLALFRAHWRLKLLLSVIFNCLFWTAYELMSRHAFFPPRTVPLTWLDLNVPFQPVPWGWIYLSQFSFTSVIPWLLSTKEGIRRYMAGLCFMTAVSFLFFLFFPVAAPRPLDTGADLSMRWIITYDKLFNTFPSLHAGFLCYIGLLAWRLSGRAMPLPLAAIGVAWGAAIMYATLATKQHYAVDLVAGGILGCVSDWLAWRGSADEIAAPTIPRKSGITSQAGSR